MPFTKKQPVVSYADFLAKAAGVTHYTSSQGRRYEVLNLTGDVFRIIRLDADTDLVWALDLKQVYKAYRELNDFSTVNFSKYVPRKHSPARGLLLCLEMIV